MARILPDVFVEKTHFEKKKTEWPRKTDDFFVSAELEKMYLCSSDFGRASHSSFVPQSDIVLPSQQ